MSKHNRERRRKGFPIPSAKQLTEDMKRSGFNPEPMSEEVMKEIVEQCEASGWITTDGDHASVGPMLLELEEAIVRWLKDRILPEAMEIFLLKSKGRLLSEEGCKLFRSDMQIDG